MVFLPQFFFQESEIPHDPRTVPHISIAHTLLFGLVLTGFEEVDALLLIFEVVFDDGVESGVALG